jgi:chemotaxis protein MotA
MGAFLMDLATLVGLVLGFVCLLGAFILEGGKAGALLSYTAAMIVLGGTVGATVISFTVADLKKVPTLFAIAFKDQTYDSAALIQNIVKFSTQARREGVLSLENNLEQLDDSFLRMGLQMIIDGIETSVLRDLMENEVYYMEQRHERGISIFEIAGGYAPTMGIVGTVMGLVHVLGNMSTPDALAPAIAVAFIATLYGISTANILWLPIASKLKVRNSEEILYRSLTVEGLLAIQEKENPNFIREKLILFLNSHIKQQLKGE